MEVGVGYNIICEKLCNPECTATELYEILQKFRSEINSERLIEKIHCLRDLVKILERRDIINEKSIRMIGHILKRPIYENFTNNYNDYNCDFQFEHVDNVRPGVPNRRVLPSVSSDVEQRINETVSSSIGKQWKIFARKLKIKECQIDQLEIVYPSVSDRVKEILSYYKQTCDERYWRMNLCEALEGASRKDLAIEVNRIISMYS